MIELVAKRAAKRLGRAGVNCEVARRNDEFRVRCFVDWRDEPCVLVDDLDVQYLLAECEHEAGLSRRLRRSRKAGVLAAAGWSYADIAVELGVSLSTVRNYVKTSRAA